VYLNLDPQTGGVARAGKYEGILARCRLLHEREWIIMPKGKRQSQVFGSVDLVLALLVGDSSWREMTPTKT
jgi:hypothetical protein